MGLGLFVVLLIWAFCLKQTTATIYEARNSDDVDFFKDQNPVHKMALLFYNYDDTVNIDDVLSIFKDSKDKGASSEPWVKNLNGTAHLMKINYSNPDIKAIINEYNINDTPKVVVLDNQKAVLNEMVDPDTYFHIKEIFVKDKNTQSTSPKGSNPENTLKK